MASKTILAITTGVGRLVSGSMYVARDTDADGNKRLIKNGANAGQPFESYDFSVAFPKTPGVAHWSQDPQAGRVNSADGQPWLQAIWALGHAEFPQQAQSRDFSWKIADGDSTEVNKKGNRNCDKDGWPGHWIVHFSSMQRPKILDYLNAKGAELTDVDAVMRGYYVQVMCEFVSNAPSPSPGLYANHQAVARIAYGPVIRGADVDVSKAGFGQGIQLPPGATVTPPAAVGNAAPPPAPAAAPAPVASPPPPVVAAPPAPPAPVAPARDLTRQMLPAANNIAYEEYIKAGWTDETLRSAGYMV